jgi:hypothetical protein
VLAKSRVKVPKASNNRAFIDLECASGGFLTQDKQDYVAGFVSTGCLRGRRSGLFANQTSLIF